jgi:hypothetical protein
MPCLLGILALAFPRIVLILVFLFSNYLDRAYQSIIWPVLGFVFLPLTTLAYAWAINTRGSVDGLQLAVVVLAVLIDLGLLGGSTRGQKRERLL